MAKKKTTVKAKETDISKLTVKDAKAALQKLVLDLRAGVEQDVSKVKKYKKHIARLLTAENNPKK